MEIYNVDCVYVTFGCGCSILSVLVKKYHMLVNNFVQGGILFFFFMILLLLFSLRDGLKRSLHLIKYCILPEPLKLTATVIIYGTEFSGSRCDESLITTIPVKDVVPL